MALSTPEPAVRHKPLALRVTIPRHSAASSADGGDANKAHAQKMKEEMTRAAFNMLQSSRTMPATANEVAWFLRAKRRIPCTETSCRRHAATQERKPQEIAMIPLRRRRLRTCWWSPALRSLRKLWIFG
jgi:hypothetical protein